MNESSHQAAIHQIAIMRAAYEEAGLSRSTVADDPLEQFDTWMTAAVEAEVPQADTMMLATSTPQGVPSVRAVLLKGYDARGFRFYTNYQSRKAAELEENPRVGFAIVWIPLHRQVRAEGTVERLSDEESDSYFRTRPRRAQLSAWASPQSEVVVNRGQLEERVIEAAGRFGGGEVPRPPQWGGFLVVPELIEFWQGRPDRLHDRILYRRGARGWRTERLAP